MAYVVCAPCHDCKYTDCVVVCPCDCFYQDEFQLHIDPEECIDCSACEPECPVEAIFRDTDVPARWTHFIELNAQRVLQLKQRDAKLTERQPPKEGPGCARRLKGF
jgi:ferredoxin